MLWRTTYRFMSVALSPICVESRFLQLHWSAEAANPLLAMSLPALALACAASDTAAAAALASNTLALWIISVKTKAFLLLKGLCERQSTC